MNNNFTQFAFTDSVRKAQEKYGSRKSYQKMEEAGPDQSRLFHREMNMIKTRDGFYLSTVGENGWPYVQFRGGPKGFLKVIDQKTIGYADFRGNMQYISTGNIQSTKKASLFLMDYPTQTRLKIWAEAEILDPAEHPDLAEKFIDMDYRVKVERLVLFHVKAFDWNCPQHIPQRFTLEEISDLLQAGLLKVEGNEIAVDV